jgi:hypothetical protein
MNETIVEKPNAEETKELGVTDSDTILNRHNTVIQKADACCNT